MCSWTYYRIPKDSKEPISLYWHIRDLTHAHTHMNSNEQSPHNYEQWRWQLRIGNPHSTPCPTLEATFGVTRLVDKTWVVPSSLGNVLVSVVRPVIWCQESWDNVIMSQAHGGRQVMGMKEMWDSSECPKKRFSFEIIPGKSKESKVLKFMVCRGDELGRWSFLYVSKWTVLF